MTLFADIPFGNMKRTLATLALLLASTGLAACEEPAPAAPLIPVPLTPPRPAPIDALEEAMRAREETEAYALSPFGTPSRMTLNEGERQSFAEVLHPGFCYKLLVESEDSITDVDAYLFDANSVLMQQDAREGGDLALGRDRPICIPEAGMFRTELRVVHGHGSLLAQWYVNR